MPRQRSGEWRYLARRGIAFALNHLRRMLSLPLMFAVILSGCELPITQDTEAAWQRNFSQAMIVGYTDFVGHFVDSDAAVYVFSYALPQGFDAGQAVSVLRRQIEARNRCYQVTIESANELQMRCPTMTLGASGFDEFRLAVDANRRRVTVMFANLDSPAEQEAYVHFEAAFRTAQRARK